MNATDQRLRPLYPLHAMTTYELAAYRRDLEREITRLPAHETGRLQNRLAAVADEEDDRRRIRANLP